jgi:hypothetical protein
MEALKINCYCDDRKMTQILGAVVRHLYDADCRQPADFDRVIGDTRVCVAFETCPGAVSVATAEIFDSDWDPLIEDSAVLTSRLRPLVDEYNRRQREAFAQAHHILADRRTSNYI